MAKKLFLIDGASGTGKSDLLTYLSDFKTDVICLNKYSTREMREAEKESQHRVDLKHIKKDEFSRYNFDYKYNYGGYQYGFMKVEINKSFSLYNNVFIIVRDIDTIKKLKKDFNYLNVISIYIYTDKDLIIKRLKRENNTQKEIDFRIKRLKVAYKSYLNNPLFYDEILINSGSENEYTRIIDTMYSKYQKSLAISENYIFVLMPFHPKYNEILNEFKDAAKLVDNALLVNRVDEQRGDYIVLDKILKNIKKASIIICDLTDERPNVYYELGYARGLKKKVILCAKKDTIIHFDISSYKMIFYTSTSHLRREIESELREHFIR